MSDLIERIDAAICRIANGDGPMRVPAEDTDPDMVLAECRKEIERLRAKLAASEAACAPFLKDGETPAECIQRWRADAAGVLELLRQEKLRSEKVEAACAQMREALRNLIELADAAMADANRDGGEYGRVGELREARAALATDAGRGWVSTEGAVEGEVCMTSYRDDAPDGDGSRDDVYVAANLPADWAGRDVLVILKPKEPTS